MGRRSCDTIQGDDHSDNSRLPAKPVLVIGQILSDQEAPGEIVEVVPPKWTALLPTRETVRIQWPKFGRPP